MGMFNKLALFFFQQFRFGFLEQKVFFQFVVAILPLVFGSVYPNIFVDVDPGSKNISDPTDPDLQQCPFHCFFFTLNSLFLNQLARRRTIKYIKYWRKFIYTFLKKQILLLS